MSNNCYRYYRNKDGDPSAVYIEDQRKETVLAFFNGESQGRLLDKTQWNREKLWGVKAITLNEAELAFDCLQSAISSQKPFPNPEKIGMLMNGTGLE